MKQTNIELADILRKYKKAYARKYQPTNYQMKIADSITACRTAEAGCHSMVCTECGNITTAYNSCRDCHCVFVSTAKV